MLLVLIRLGQGIGLGAMVLLLLGTQWYILFNVIAGASAIPSDLKEVCGVFRLTNIERWRTLFLPAIFPYLVTGCDGLGRSVERQYRGRILSFPRPDIFNRWPRRRDQPRHRYREFSPASRRNDFDGGHGVDDEPSGLETSVRARLHTVQARGLMCQPYPRPVSSAAWQG